MVSVGMSEFTFGFAFLFELTTANWTDVTAAPVLPSLIQEQNKGWDARLPIAGTPYFYQFKLADYLYRSNAKFIRDGIYNSPYFRIGLHRNDNSQQHRLLRALSAQNPETYYVAPEVRTIEQFNSSFLQKVLAQNSRLIPVRDCEDIAPTDSEQHYITFVQNNPNWIFHSDEKRKEWSYRGEDILREYRSSKERWKTVDLAFSRELLDRTIETVREVGNLETVHTILAERGHLLDEGIAGIPRGRVLQRVADLIGAVFGVTMVIVGAPQNG